jgi:hypothetical protein
MVGMLRMRLRRNAANAMRVDDRGACRGFRLLQARQHLGRHAGCDARPVVDQPAIAKAQRAPGEGCDVRLVGHQHDRDAARIEALEQRHDLDAGA